MSALEKALPTQHTNRLPANLSAIAIPQEPRILAVESSGEISQCCEAMNIRCCRLSSFDEALAHLQPHSTGCLVVDFDGLKNELSGSIRRLHKIAFGFPVVAISEDMSIANILAAIRDGASDFCPKPVNLAELAASIREACRRDREGNDSPLAVRAKLARLTKRERQVVGHCLHGLSTKAIARELNVTYQTVDKHRKRTLRKMEVVSIVGLANLLNRATLNGLGSERSCTLRAMAG